MLINNQARIVIRFFDFIVLYFLGYFCVFAIMPESDHMLKMSDYRYSLIIMNMYIKEENYNALK